MSKIKKIYCALSFTLTLLLAAPLAADNTTTGHNTGQGNLVPAMPNQAGIDQLIIKYNTNAQAGMSRTDVRLMAARAASGVLGRSVSYKRAMAAITGAHVLKLPQSISAAQASLYASQLAQQSALIEYAEPDQRRYVQRTVPNDTEFNQQWHLLAPEDFPGAANVVNAWDVSKGKPEIIVAVLDEGMTDHVDLRPAFIGGTLAQSGYDMVAIAEEAGDGDGRDSNPANPGAAATGNHTSRWHGTHVGGIIAARPDNSKFTAGVGWNTSLLAVRILSAEAGGYLSDQVDGMLWAAGESVPGVPDNPNPAHVLNMSVGSDVAFDCSRTEQNAINLIREHGISIVVAAGNLNKNVSAYAPGNCEGVITVTGVMPDGARASYSNYGELIDIAAPGDKIHSTANTGLHAPVADGSRLESGTSQAAPQVAGVIALMLAANENLLNADVVKRADLPAVLEDKLKQSVRAFPTAIDGSDEALGCNDNQKISCLCTKQTCGAGLLDAHLALKAVTTRPWVEVGEDLTVGAQASVTLDGSSSRDDDLGGKLVRLQWEQLAGPTVELADSDQAMATFTAPDITAQDQVLRFKLTATDDVGLQSSAAVSITVRGSDDGDTGGDNAGSGDDDSTTGDGDADNGDAGEGDEATNGSSSSGSGGGGSLPLLWLAALGLLLCLRFALISQTRSRC